MLLYRVFLRFYDFQSIELFDESLGFVGQDCIQGNVGLVSYTLLHGINEVLDYCVGLFLDLIKF